MTVTIHTEDVIAAIAGLSITGLTICELSEIPDAPDPRKCYLIPSPAEPAFLTNPVIDRRTFGSMGNAAQDMTYTLNYKLLYKPVGTGRGIREVIPGAFAMAITIVETIQQLTLLDGAVTWKATPGEAVLITDPSGNQWDGWTITVEVLDFIQ